MSEITVIPFRMQCPGCQAKVVVKNPELLGRSLPCPKCKHLIVVPKQGPISNLSGVPNREPSPSFDSSALTKEDYGDWDEVLSNLPQNPLGVDPEHIDWSPVESNDSNSEAGIPFQSIDTAPPQPSSARDWQNQNVKKRRQILLVATIGVLSSLLAGIGFFGFLSYMKSDGSAVADNKKNVDENKTGASGNGETPPSPPGGSNPDETLTSSQGAGSAAGSDSSTQSTNESNSPDATPSEQPGLGGNGGNGEPVVIPSMNAGNSGATASNPSNNFAENSGSGAGLPPAEKPTEQPKDSGTKPDESTAADADAAADIAYKLPPELARVKDLLNNSRGAFGSDAGFRPPSSVDELDLENLQYPEMDIFHPDAKQLGDWKQSASLMISRMSAPNDVNLAIGLEEFARLTNIGITLDWQKCRAMGVDFNPLISLKLEGKTIAGFIDETLSSKGLKLSLNAKGFPLVEPASNLDKPAVPIKWDIKDVAATGFEKETAELLISMCEVKDYCTQIDGVVVWTENATLLQQAKVYETIRHLAKITGKPVPAWPATDTFKESQFSVDAWKESRIALNRTLPETALVLESRPAIGLMHNVATLTDSQIIVDWNSAWEHGLTPTEEMILVLRNRTLFQVSKKLLVEYALEMIPIGSRTFWLTTGRVRQTSLCVVPIKPPGDLNMDLVKRTLSKLRPLGDDGLSRFQLRPVPGMEGVYFARICPPNTNTLLQEEFASVFGWQ
jgi:hypothetical protein